MRKLLERLRTRGPFETPARPRALVLGFFSTMGDTECLDVVTRWLDEIGLPHDTAAFAKPVAEAIPGALHLRRVHPADYSHLVIVCGPCWKEYLDKQGVTPARFGHCTWIGVNLTMIRPLDEWNPFDHLIERDSDRATRPDLAFLAPYDAPPVVGRCVIERQKEYGARERLADAARVIDAAIARNGLARLDIDTRWPPERNATGLTGSRDLLAAISRCEVLLTNRLHGLVFSLRAGVPAIAVDGIEGGGKLTAQAASVGWPVVATLDKASKAWMDEQMAWCRTDEARDMATACAAHAADTILSAGNPLADLADSQTGEHPKFPQGKSHA